MATHETIDTATSWVIRHTNGVEVQTALLPSRLACGVCGEPNSLIGLTGRIVCAHCSAHVVTVLERRLATVSAD